MSTWHVQHESKVRTVDEATLRQRLRKGRYSGAELVRREGETGWQRLCDLPLFAEEVPHRDDPVATARLRVLWPFLSHLAVFVFVVGTLGATNDTWPWWSIFWMFGLASHLAKSVRQIKGLGIPPLPSYRPTPLPSSPPVARPARSAWRTRVEEALAALSAAPGGASLDLDALRRDADELDRANLELKALSSPELRARLGQELTEIQARVDQAGDARTAEAYQGAAAAIRDRLSGAEAAAEAWSRLEARQMALLHQLEGLRLSLATARLDDAPAPDLADKVREIQASTDARAEVERTLAAARQGKARVS